MAVPLFDLGRTRLDTRRERRRRVAGTALALAGAVCASWVAAAIVSWLPTGEVTWPSLRWQPLLASSEGRGGLLGLPRVDEVPTSAPGGSPDLNANTGATSTPAAAEMPHRLQSPVALTWPASAAWTVVVALPLWLVWLRFAVHPVWARLRESARHRGLATRRQIRRVLSERAVRRTGRYTLPGTTWWCRFLLPTAAFGYQIGHHLRDPQLGHSRQMRSARWIGGRRGGRCWADWEQRIRVVARTGWGKTDRLLVPIIRALPGPALVASIEPGIFDRTVLARRRRRPRLRWRWLSLVLGRCLPAIDYPVAVVDVSAPDRRYAAGYPQVRWSPIVGCADYTIAYRRAVALVNGIDTTTPQAGGSDNDRFFRDSASEVLAAWLHAADLSSKDIDDLADWLRHTDDPTATRILRDHPHAEPSAAVNIIRHLDPAAGRTTSGVLRYLTLAINSLTATEGRQLCGRRDTDTQFDMEKLIATAGTVYLLADSSRLHRVRPLLSLFAAEMFLAAEAVALRTSRRRLPQPFIAVVDELRYGITIPNLPYVASAQRKYGIGYVYGIQTASQEDAVYGSDAPALRAAAGVSIIGGIDIDSARDVSDRAGSTPVVTPTRGSRTGVGPTWSGAYSEQLQHQDTLTVADQQRLGDGQAVVIVRGLAPFLATIPSYRDSRALNRTITAEADTVARQIAGARNRDATTHNRHNTAASAGADYRPPRGPS